MRNLSPGEFCALFGVGAGFGQEVPLGELVGDFEGIVCGGGVAGDIGGFEGFDGVGGTLLAGAELGEADHPGGVVVGEQVELGEVGGG